MPKITVLLPIYNGDAFLDETLQSLRQQSFTDFEVLCIDDCSKDNSAEVVQRHAALDDRIIYLNTGRNLGSAAKAVNFAAQKAKGRWFVYSSQDDLFSPDWLEQLHDRAQVTGADAVLPDVVFYHAGHTNDRRIIGYRGDRSAILTGRDAFVASLDWTIPGNALWPISFLQRDGFDDFGAFADEYTVRRFFLKCSQVAFCSGVFFYRQDNADAVTKKPSPNRLDAADTSWRLWHLVLENDFEADVRGPFALRTLRTLIRSQAIIDNNPSLSGETPRLTEIWRSMQLSDAFQTSLSPKGGKRPLASRIYRRATQSYVWFRLLARVSAFLSKRKPIQ